MVLALNCGHAVNPGQIEAQVQGSVAFGLTAALYGEMPVENGRMTNLNFDSYEIMRLAEMPKVETVIVPTYDFWGGVGEPTICVVTPAVLNAIFAATGKPMRSLRRYSSAGPATPRRSRRFSRHDLRTTLPKRASLVATCMMMSVTMASGPPWSASG
jgi:CO/xanthine dehydrogenase Mo-binding subunit